MKLSKLQREMLQRLTEGWQIKSSWGYHWWVKPGEKSSQDRVDKRTFGSLNTKKRKLIKYTFSTSDPRKGKWSITDEGREALKAAKE